MKFEIEDAEAVRDSGKALLVESPEFDDDGEWIPQSQIHDDSEVYKEGHTGTLVVTAWFARKKGWL